MRPRRRRALPIGRCGIPAASALRRCVRAPPPPTLGHFGGERRSGRDRDAAADDAVGTKDSQRIVHDMHRAALALAVACALAEDLREHPLEFSAFGDQMAVAAMGRGDAVGGAQGRVDTDGAGLLADRKMDEAGNFAADAEVLELEFELPDALHPAIHFQQEFFADIHLESSPQSSSTRLLLPKTARARRAVRRDCRPERCARLSRRAQIARWAAPWRISPLACRKSRRLAPRVPPSWDT